MILQSLLFLLAATTNVTLPKDTYDLTGQHSFIIRHELDLNGSVIIADSLFASDTLFLFLIDKGKIFNGTIRGANGNTQGNSGYFGAVRIKTTGTIRNVDFRNSDKWAVDLRGIRGIFTDTTYISNCTFSGHKREGYGYGVWNQYGTVVIDSCDFLSGRHHIDGSSEGSRTIIRNSTFDRAYISAIHNHDYGGYSGQGVDIINCIFYENSVNIDLHPPFPPNSHVIQDTINWNGQYTGFHMKLHGVRAELIANGKVIRQIPAQGWWRYHYYKHPVKIRLIGSGVAYIDDWNSNLLSENFETGSKVKIRYVTPGKVDRFVGEQVDGDYSLRIRLTDGELTVE